MIEAATLLCHEIVGLNVHILECTIVTLRGVSGRVISETKNTFSIRTSKGTKLIPKKNATKIRFALESGACFVTGSSLVGRPEDRVSRNC